MRYLKRALDHRTATATGKIRWNTGYWRLNDVSDHHSLKATFDTNAYWQRRVGTDADLGVVGHRSLGASYNAYIYRRRVDTLTAFTRSLGLNIADQSVLDIGCGSGFYTEYWRALDVQKYTGLDISSDSTERLQQEFESFRFVTADISNTIELDSISLSANIVTVFDVFYHIVDDRQFSDALHNIASLLDKDGVLLVFDQLAKEDYSLTPHVKFRGKSAYARHLNEAGLEIVETHHLFNLLVPPMFANRLVDVPIAAVYKVIGWPMRAIPSLGRLFGWLFYQTDKMLHRLGAKIPNNQFFVIRHKNPSDTKEHE